MATYNFHSLSSFDFEELVRDLLQADWKQRLESFTTGSDSGIDLRAFTKSDEPIIVQCKHFAGSNFAKLRSHLKTIELPKIKALSPKRYVLATSLGLTPAGKKALKELLHPFIKTTKDILGSNDLENLLRLYPIVVENNFKLWLTSTSVLQRVLHNAEKCQTEFEVDRVRRRLPLYVQNEAYPRALKILEDTRIVVISGVPGIGKTTLADLLLYAHLDQNYQPVIVQAGIADAKRLFNKNTKQIFYFDDFLGQTLLRDNDGFLAHNQDAALLGFMDAIRHSKNRLFRESSG